mmetsp:Transcript_6126/g.9342  ORF Transcript_6126/g.9342 Transcript_6126/m.9342 type:complete len:95 (+) Transcript_6126:544-828(+)
MSPVPPFPLEDLFLYEEAIEHLSKDAERAKSSSDAFMLMRSELDTKDDLLINCRRVSIADAEATQHDVKNGITQFVSFIVDVGVATTKKTCSFN